MHVAFYHMQHLSVTEARARALLRQILACMSCVRVLSDALQAFDSESDDEDCMQTA